MNSPITQNRRDRAYRIEVRATSTPFQLVDGPIIGTEWQPLPVQKVGDGAGVPDGVEDLLTNTYGYYAAVALGAWFMSAHEWRATVRLVPYEREISTKLVRVEGTEIVLEDAIVRMVKDCTADSRSGGRDGA